VLRDVALQVIDQHPVSVHDPPRFRSAFGGIALLRQRLPADQSGVGSIKSLHETARELALPLQSRAARFFVQEFLEGPILLPIRIEMLEDFGQSLPKRTLRRQLAMIGSILLAQDGHRDETRFIEQPRSLRRVTMYELGAELDGRTRVCIVDRHDAPTDAAACLEQAHILTRVRELARRDESCRARPDNYCVEQTECAPADIRLTRRDSRARIEVLESDVLLGVALADFPKSGNQRQVVEPWSEGSPALRAVTEQVQTLIIAHVGALLFG
jgi:hypothetical protein